MADGVDHRQARWVPLVLGLLLLLPGLAVAVWWAIGLVDGRLAGPLVEHLFLVLALVALLATALAGVRLGALGVRMDGVRLAAAWRALRNALVLLGVSTLVGVLAALSREDQAGEVVVEVTLSGVWSVVDFLLAGFAGRRARAGEEGSRHVSRRLVACSTPLLLQIGLFAVPMVLLAMVEPVDLRPYVAMNDARVLATELSTRASEHGWPPYGGRNFVLSLVASRQIEVDYAENIDLFFCPSDASSGTRPAQEAYRAVTDASLAERRFPTLTDFAGRRNDEEAWRLTPEDVVRSEPILGCRVGERVIVGFSDGTARLLGREELGLGPDDGIVFGEGSASPLLQPLSDR